MCAPKGLRSQQRPNRQSSVSGCGPSCRQPVTSSRPRRSRAPAAPKRASGRSKSSTPAATSTMALLCEEAGFAAAIGRAAEALGGLDPAFVEKDYWVTQVLRALHTEHPHAFVFKGGTSLS